MSEEYRCECGKRFETKLGLGVHRSFCKPEMDRMPDSLKRGGPARKPEHDPEFDALRDRVEAEVRRQFPQAEEVKVLLYQGDIFVEVWVNKHGYVGPAAALGIEQEERYA